MKTFTVEHCAKTKEGAFFNKLVHKTTKVIDTPFGKVESQSSETYYIFSDVENKKGKVAELDISLFDIVEKKYDFVDEKSGEMKTIMLKYLYPAR